MTISNNNRYILTPTKAPALPFAPVVYDRQYQDALTNILRQYFNQNDNLNSVLLDGAGAAYLSAPFADASGNTNQYATAVNTPTVVQWDTLENGNGFTLNPDNSATAQYTGYYKIDYSLQMANTDTAIHNAFVWLRINGIDAAKSTSQFSVPNKHGSVNGFLVAYSSIVFLLNQGDSVSLYWATDQAATSGGATGIYMPYIPAQTSPFAMPSTPAAIGSIVFVSRP